MPHLKIRYSIINYVLFNINANFFLNFVKKFNCASFRFYRLKDRVRNETTY